MGDLDRLDQPQWPAISWEEAQWEASSGWGVRATRESNLIQKYKSALVPPIADLSPVPSPEAFEAAEEAAHELGRFDAENGNSLQGYAPVLLRSEAASSSRIEDLTASARGIFTAEAGAKASRNSELIAANTRALRAAIKLAHELSPHAIQQMHAVLMEGQDKHTPGQWRTEPVWIGSRHDSPVGADYVAPNWSHIPDLIEDVVAFSRRFDVSALVSVAVAHAQFETIHPFTDGNGRTGRAFAQAILRYRGITRSLAVPVSAGLLVNTGGYFDALTAYRQGDISPIVQSFADAAMRSIGNARILISELAQIRASWEEKLRVRKSSNAWFLLDVAMQQPVFTAADAAGALGVQLPNVYPPLRTLTDAGILKYKREYQSPPLWRSEEILVAIDRFAQRAGRRAGI